MPWGKLDDQLHDNEKVWSFTDKEFRVWMYSISYCNKKRRRDPAGTLTQEAAETVCRLAGAARKVIEGVVRKRGWDRIDGGYVVHDFSLYGPKEDQTATERQRRHRDKEERHADEKEVVTPASRRDSGRDSHRDAHVRGSPVPVPVPSGSTSSEHQPEEVETVPNTHTVGERALAVNGSPGYSDDFEAFWADYPKKREKHAAWLAWQKRVKDVRPSVLIAAAAHLAEHVEEAGTEDQFIPNAATFLGPQRKYADFVAGAPRPVTRQKHAEPAGFDGIREAFADVAPRRALV
jgi:hypothetical protein